MQLKTNLIAIKFKISQKIFLIVKNFLKERLSFEMKTDAYFSQHSEI